MGYVGKILRVNLSTGKIFTEDLDYEIASKFIGGRGYGVKLLFDMLKPKTDALSEENIIIFMTGPLT
ncbi:MAG: aldehyde ferredoxin oxidoreductase, partial [Candidatus Hydrothermarchaeota archaeon]